MQIFDYSIAKLANVRIPLKYYSFQHYFVALKSYPCIMLHYVLCDGHSSTTNLIIILLQISKVMIKVIVDVCSVL